MTTRKPITAAGVRHVIWSILEDTRVLVPLDDARMPTLQGRYKMPHFDAKAGADAFFEQAGVPVTSLVASDRQGGPAHLVRGHRTMRLRRFPAAGRVRRGAVGIAGEHLTGARMAVALGRPDAFNDVPPDVCRGFGFPGAEDVGNMFQYKRDFEPQYRALRSVEESRRLNPTLQTLAMWLERHASRIPIPA
jgi:hypothetical protein